MYVTKAELAADDGASLVGFIQDGANAVAQTVEQKARESFTLGDYGADNGGSTAVDGAFDDALADSYLDHNRTIRIANGAYLKTGPTIIGQGVMLIGEGSQGSTDGYGTVLRQQSDHTILRWDGSNASYLGTGGGLMNVLLLKEDGYTSGNAIELVATTVSTIPPVDKRPGEMVLSNVLASTLGSGRFERGLVIDGTAAAVSGGVGVRSVVLFKVRMANVTIPGESFLFKQVSHLYGFGVACDQGAGAAAGIKIEGKNDGIYLVATGCGGSLEIVENTAGNETRNFHYSGKIGGDFANHDDAVAGTLDASCGQGAVITNKSPNLKIRTNINPDFQISMNAVVSNATGDGTLYELIWVTEEYDQGNNWNGPSSEFDCSCAGIYQFHVSLLLSGLSSQHGRADVEVAHIDGSSGGGGRSFAKVVNPFAISTGGYATIDLSMKRRLKYGDKVKVFLSVAGGTKTVGIYGASGTCYTWFEGRYCGA